MPFRKESLLSMERSNLSPLKHVWCAIKTWYVTFARRRVLDAFTGLRLQAAHHGVDQGAGGEVLAGTGFGFIGVLLQQAFVQVAQAVFLGAEPVDLVQGLDHLFQMARLPQAGLGVGVDGADQRVVVYQRAVAVLAGGQAEQDAFVVVQQVDAGFAVQVGPAAALW